MASHIYALLVVPGRDTRVTILTGSSSASRKTSGLILKRFVTFRPASRPEDVVTVSGRLDNQSENRWRCLRHQGAAKVSDNHDRRSKDWSR